MTSFAYCSADLGVVAGSEVSAKGTKTKTNGAPRKKLADNNNNNNNNNNNKIVDPRSRTCFIAPDTTVYCKTTG